MLISTRKGLFVAEAIDGVYKVTRGHFIGDNVSLAMVDSRAVSGGQGSASDHPRSSWYAALDHGHFGAKLHRSDDLGETWTEVATPAYPSQPEGEKEVSAMGREVKWATTLIWALAPALDQDNALWCGTIPGGLFRSEDRGTTWQLVNSLWFHPARKEWFGGGRDDPGIHSICVDPRDPKTIAVGVSCGGVWRTRDRGETWTNTATGMRAAFMPPDRQFDVNIQDPHLIVQSPSSPEVFWAQHHNGIFRSTNDMESWHEIEQAGPSTFGFPVVVDPKDANTAWFVPAIKDEKRIPVDGKLVVTRTRDGGKTFDVLHEGLPDTFAYDLVFRHGLAIAPDGTLAMGSTTGNLYTSRDAGDSWACVSHHLPPVHAVTFVTM